MNNTLSDHYEQVVRCADWLKERFGPPPRVAIITGSSGPSSLEKHFSSFKNLKLAKPFPVPTTPGHDPSVTYGKIGEVEAIWFRGRVHFYEDPDDRYRPVVVARALALWGVPVCILTNAAGTLVGHNPGQICVITDHDSGPMGHNPLHGDPRVMANFGARHPDMNQVYDAGLRELAINTWAARDKGTNVITIATYTMVPGPNFETPLEARNRTAQTQLLGMSTVTEAMALHHMGVRVLAYSVVTNRIHTDHVKHKLTHEEVQDVVKGIDDYFADYLAEVVIEIATTLEQ